MANNLKKVFKMDNLIFSLLWILIILPKSIQLILIYLFAFFLYMKKGVTIKKNKIAIAMWILSAVHLFAILYNVFFLHTSNVSRLYAAINTFLLWVITPLYYEYYHYHYKYDGSAVGKACCFNLIILGCLAVIACYFYYVKGFELYNIGSNGLYTTTYLDGVAEMKFFGLNDFSNMNLFFIMLMFGLAIPYLLHKSSIYRIFIIFVTSFCVILIHSRSGYVLFTICLLYYFYKIVPKKYRSLFIVCGCLSLFFILIIFGNQLWSLFFNKIINGNTSSNNFRIELLSTSIAETLEMSPIWGMGIKRYLVEGYPLGSHSTYVGFFYKTGFVGLVIGLYCFYKSNSTVLFQKNKDLKTSLISIFLICFIILFAIEDVDGANWSIILYFSVLGIYSAKETKDIIRGDKKYENKNAGDLFASIL